MAAGTLDRKPLAIGLGEKPARSLGLAGLSARWLRSGGPGSSRSRRRPVRKFDPDRRARLLPTLARRARAIDAGRLLQRDEVWPRACASIWCAGGRPLRRYENNSGQSGPAPANPGGRLSVTRAA